jgi:carbon starvation protein
MRVIDTELQGVKRIEPEVFSDHRGSYVEIFDTERYREVCGDVTFVRTDPDLPPVAIIDRSPITTRHKLTFGAIAVLGAVAWAVIAFVRGETVNAVWFVIAAICTYVIGFRFYARLIEMKIVQPRDEHATPAEIYENGTDYLPTDRRVLFGHHFAAIAGAGPLVGPVLAIQMGYLPGAIWILLGAVFAGCVQDFLVLSISTRRRGRALPVAVQPPGVFKLAI